MADDRTYYVICDDNCKFESMTKEEILTAITNAIEQGGYGDIDTGFVTKIKEQNKNVALQFWVGTQAEYNALDPKPQNTFCVITDDTSKDDILSAIDSMNSSIEEANNNVVELSNDIDALSEYERLQQIMSSDSALLTFDFNKYNGYNLYAYTSKTSAIAIIYSGISVDRTLLKSGFDVEEIGGVSNQVRLMNGTSETMYYKIVPFI